MNARPAKTIEDAQWAVDAVHEQQARVDDLWTALRYVPERYDAYGRIFHAPWLMDHTAALEVERIERESLRRPAGTVSDDARRRIHEVERRPPTRRTWAAVAESNGKRPHPLMQWSSISAGERHADAFDYGWEMEREGVEALVEALAEHTDADEKCTFLIWHGYNLDQLADLGAPRIKFGGELYFVLEGPLESVLSFEWRWRSAEAWPTTFTPPNAWWPASKRWFLSFGIDEDCTYAGGSKAVIQSLVNHPRLEAAEIGRDDSLAGDSINGTQPRVRVSAVFDREFGGHCTVPAAQSESAWIVDSPTNREYLPAARSEGDVTSFAETSRVELLAVIDEHHGKHSAGATWNEVEIIGAHLDPELEAALTRMGFGRIEETALGFCAFR